MKKLLTILLLVGFSNLAFSQSLVQTFTDRCTGEVKVFTVPMNGQTVIAFYDRTATFTSAQFQNGELRTWLEETYAWWLALNPCSTAQTNVTTTQAVTQQTTTAATQAATAATAAVPAVPASPPPAQSAPASQPATTNTASNDTSTQNTTGSTQSSGSTDSGGNTSNTDTGSTGDGGGTTSNDSGGTNEGGSDSSGGAETEAKTEETQTEETKTEETKSEEKTEEVKEEKKEETKEESKEEKKEEEKSEEKEESKEEEKSEEEKEEEKKKEEEEKKKEEKKKKKKKKVTLGPPIITANTAAMQGLDGTYSYASTFGVSRSSLMGDKTYGLNTMIWSNLKQFMLTANYSQVHINKEGRVSRVYSASIGGAKMFTTVMGMMNHSVVFLGKKGSAAGLALGSTLTSIEFNVRENQIFFDELLAGASITGFYTKPIPYNRFTFSPMLAVSSAFMSYELFSKNTIWNKDLMIIGGLSTTFNITKRFGANLGINSVGSTNPDFPIIMNFTIGSRFSF